MPLVISGRQLRSLEEEEAVIFTEKFIDIFNEIAMREPWCL